MTTAQGERRLAGEWVGAGGRARRLVGARVTDAYELSVGTVVCVSSMHVSRPDRRDRLLLVSALAISVLSLLGAAGERIGYDRWLKANTVKRRTHSLFR